MTIPLAAMLLSVIWAQTADPVPPPIASSTSVSLHQQRASLIEAESKALLARASLLEQDGRADQAQAVRALIASVPSLAGPFQFRPIPVYTPSALRRPADLPEPQPQAALDQEAQDIRNRTAEALYGLALRAAEPGVERFGFANECLLDTIARAPDHREARRLLGYIARADGWATPQALVNLEAGLVLHDLYGWVPDSWLDKLAQGLLPAPFARGKPTEWLPAAEANRLRETWDQAWRIHTEHFAMRTNLPIDEAIRFGRRLEALREVFMILFADVFGADRLPLARRFRQPDLWAKGDEPRLAVSYYAQKDEYVDALIGSEGPSVADTLGMYLPARKRGPRSQPGQSYFFRNLESPIDAQATLFHEASHQVLFESAGPTPYEQNIGHYWLWEGLATYFETFTPRADGSYLVGGMMGPRLEKAWQDIIAYNHDSPMEELCTLSKSRFHDPVEVYSYYAKGMAMTVFLMHGAQGKYRDGFLDYARDVYRGRFRPGGNGVRLDRRLGVSFAELDSLFREFLRENRPENTAAERTLSP